LEFFNPNQERQMDLQRFWMGVISLGTLFPMAAMAQTKTAASPTPVPTVLTATPQPAAIGTVTPVPTVGAEEKAAHEESTGGGKSFVPHWTGQLGLSYSNQPTQQGQGQVNKELNLTGTYNLTESGHFFSVGITSGQQMLEGAGTNYGAVVVDGGLGLGILQPSLSFTLQEGASALSSYSSTLNLNFLLLDSLAAGLTGSVGLENHQGPASQIYPNAANPDTILEVDDGDWTGGVVVSFVPWDFLTLSLTGEQETDITFKTQNIYHTTSNPLNLSTRMPSLILEGEAVFLKDFQLQLSAQAGQIYYSAGTSFNRVTGKTQTFSQPTQAGFTGYTLGLLYNFQ
jgi:hypothetical protein